MKAIVVSFDHLPVGFLGLHGNTWVDTPAFDRLAAEGVVFESHYAANVAGVGRDWWPEPGPDGAKVVDGVRSVAFVEAGTEVPAGFDEVVEVTGEDGLDVPMAETPFARMVLAAGEWLANAPDDGWLLWLRSRGVPRPWLPPRELAEKYVELFEDLEEDFLDPADYEGDLEWELVELAGDDDEEEGDEFTEGDEDDDWDGGSEGDLETLSTDEGFDLDEAEEFDELLVALASVGLREDTSGIEVADWLLVRAVYGGYVSLLDRGLGELMRAVAETVGEDVLVAVTGGAGESLGERAELPEACDALGLGEERTHTPLLLRGPGLLVGTRSRELACTANLRPTLLDWFGSTGSNAVRSVLPLALGEETERDGSLVLLGEGDVRGIRTADRYLVTDGEAERLFVKPEDVWDLNDVSGQEPGTVEELSASLSADPRNRRDPV